MASHYNRQPAESEAIVLAMLTKAADRGDPCPSNNEIAFALGAGSCSRGSEVLNRLEKRGIIKVERGQASRAVTITATGKRTAGIITAVHWRYRPENMHRRNVRYSRSPAPEPSPPPPKLYPVTVNRDPCSYCGVRADVGCSHQVRWA